MRRSTSSLISMKPSSFTSTSSTTFTLLILHDVAYDTLDEPGRMCRGSVQLYKTTKKLMWPLSWQGMVYTFIKTDNTAAALYILNYITVKSLQYITTNVTEKSPFQEANSCSATHSIPYLFQNTWAPYYFHHSLTHTLSPNSFSPPIFCSHTYSSLNNITITAHMFSALQTPCWHNKMGDKKKVRHWKITEPLT